MFHESGDMRSSSSKSVLKNKLSIAISDRRTIKSQAVIVDGCAILWIINWPNSGQVKDFVSCFIEYIEKKLQTTDIYLVFDRYFAFSIKSATRTERSKASKSLHKLARETLLPPRNVVLANVTNKQQIIYIICDDLVDAITRSMNQAKNTLVVTRPSGMPLQVKDGVTNERPDLENFNEEADVIITHQVIHLMTRDKYHSIRVLCDDTDVFVLLVYYYLYCNLIGELTMEATSGERQIIDIGKTIQQHKDIVPSLISAHALTGCDTVAHKFGIGKSKVINRLKDDERLTYIGNLSDVLKSRQYSYVAAMVTKHLICQCVGTNRGHQKQHMQEKVPHDYDYFHQQRKPFKKM